MIEQQRLLGKVPTEGGPPKTSFPGYQKVRVPPYDFGRMYGNPTDPPDGKHWLQINASLPKPSQKSMCRFILEINCYAVQITNQPNPWAMHQEADERGSGQDTFDALWPLFGRCIAGLYRKKYVRLLAIDSVGDVEDDTYTIPSSLFAFHQAEWPATLYFPAVHACPSMVPPQIIDIVLAFQSVAADTLAKRRLQLGGRAAEDLDAEDLTTGERRNLQTELGFKGRTVKHRQTGRRRGGKKTGQASGSGVIDVDLEEDEMID